MNHARRVTLALALAATGALAGPPTLPDLTLEATSGPPRALRQVVGAAPLTVFIFFSATCPCMTAHDARVIELARAYQARGVQVFAVDSETGEALVRDRPEVERRHYPFPVLADPGARLAAAYGVVFAATAVVVDRAGQLGYRGGIDGDKRAPRPGSRFLLEEAIRALLEGRPADPAEAKTFGCYLRVS